MFHAGAIALVTTVELRDGNFLFAAERHFFERDLQIVTQIVAALRLRRVLSAAEETFKNASARRAAENLAEDFERIMKAAGTAEPAAGPGTRIECRVAVLIVSRASLRITQCLVGLADFLESFLGGFVP